MRVAQSLKGAVSFAGAVWLTSGASGKVLALLNADGEEARVVGGAVRNALLGLPVGEIDIATTALPDKVVHLAKDAGIKSVPTGIEHGTVTLVADGQPFEVTTLREDIETYGRKAKVAFGRDWARDAMRRDFTINGLSVSRDGTVHDSVSGLADIEAKRVRFIGEPTQRIAEDYLRILRFFRMHAAYGEGDLDDAGLAACISGRDGLSELSAERIRAEVLKLLAAKGALKAVVAMEDAGILLKLTGGVAYRGALEGMIDFERALGLDADPVRRLGALGVAVTEDAKRLTQRLRLSKVETTRLDSMGHRWWRLTIMQDANAKARLYRLGEARYRDRIMLAAARSRHDGDAGRWIELATLPDRWTAPVFPLKAADFIARGIGEGPALGHVIALAEDAWIAASFPLDAITLQSLADETVARFRHDHRL